jgi:hypothetical protein
LHAFFRLSILSSDEIVYAAKNRFLRPPALNHFALDGWPTWFRTNMFLQNLIILHTGRHFGAQRPALCFFCAHAREQKLFKHILLKHKGKKNNDNSWLAEQRHLAAIFLNLKWSGLTDLGNFRRTRSFFLFQQTIRPFLYNVYVLFFFFHPFWNDIFSFQVVKITCLKSGSQ